MLLRVLGGALAAAVLSGSITLAQDLRGPSELPPSSFRGQQYTDSRGCVFLRAGVGGTTNWVPRISANRRQLCGYPPTFARVEIPTVEVAEAPAAAAPAPAPAPTPVRSTRAPGAPLDTIASTTTPPRIRDTSGAGQVPAARYAAAPTAAPAPTVVSGAAPREAAVAAPAPRPALRTGTPSPGPAPTVVSAAPGPRVAEAAPAPALGLPGLRVAGRTPSPAPAPTVVSGGADDDAVAVAAAPAYGPRRSAVLPSPGPAPTVVSGGGADRDDSPAPRAVRRIAVAVTPGCPLHAPYGERVATTDGRSTLLCVTGPDRIPAYAMRTNDAPRNAPAPGPSHDYADNGDAPVARAPAAPVTVVATAPAATAAPRKATTGRYACPASTPVLRRVPKQGGGTTLVCTDGQGPHAAAPAPVVPRGYKPAWDDDRLNPDRGPRTIAGDAEQDRVWTRETPARLVSEPVPGQRRVVVSASNAPRKAKPEVTVSTSGAPVKAARPAKAAAARLFVQVGSFGVPENADRARARLAAAGLPVAEGKAKGLRVVYAGPFASRAEAEGALRAARSAGFGDAFIR
jgi:hypothetical protein